MCPRRSPNDGEDAGKVPWALKVSYSSIAQVQQVI